MNFLYWFGFYIEYRLRCLLRGLAGFSRWLGRALGALLAALLRPVVLACIRLRQASPKALLGLLVPALGALAFAWLVQTTLAQPSAQLSAMLPTSRILILPAPMYRPA